MGLRPYQKDLIDKAREVLKTKRSACIQLATGGGKCFAKNTRILMFDGTIKNVQDIVPGDMLMGPDSKARKVLTICRGTELLYEIKPKKGNSYIVNESHILSLKSTCQRKNPKYPSCDTKGKIVNISIVDYLKKSKRFKHLYKGYRTGVVFKNNKKLIVDPYFLGLWLGDGHSRIPAITTMDNEIKKYLEDMAKKIGYKCVYSKAGGKSVTIYITHSIRKLSNTVTLNLRKINVLKNKHIPLEYLTASHNNRLKLLAGLLDTDGFLYHNNCYEYCTKLEKLKNDVLFLARSLGFAAYDSEKIVKGKIYYRIRILGDTKEIPCLIERKKSKERTQKKDVLLTGIDIIKKEVGEYFGFEISGTDRLFLLEDFTVVHNTVIFSAITQSAFNNNKRSWIIAPRDILMAQASEHLKKRNVPHGMIRPKSEESRAFLTHIASKGTLARRFDKIKNWPDIIIVDEIHVNYIFQLLLKNKAPQKTKILGFSATPERLSGEGLSNIYDELIEGPHITELVGMGYLTDMKYFCPPIEGLDKVHRKGTEYDENELHELLEKRKIYGDAIEHYRHYAHNKSCLVYCRSVKAAADVAQRFSQAGYKFENIDGKMSWHKRKILIKALTDGDIHGLTSCDLITYGLDVPRVECISMLRPTLSLALYMQMIGRGLRTYNGKKYCVVLDHVNNLRVHGHPFSNHVWRFSGSKKRSSLPGESVAVMKLCPKCFMYYEGAVCDNCGTTKSEYNLKSGDIELEVIDGRLVEAKTPEIIKLKDRPVDEQDEIKEDISSLISSYRRTPEEGPIRQLLDIAENLGYNPLWVYYQLSQGQYAVNIPLLHEICRIKGYKPSWVHFKKLEIQENLQGKKHAMQQDYKKLLV